MTFSEELKRRVRRRAHFKCCLCHQLGVDIHHIVPQAECGPDTEDNAAPLCPSCHDTYGANPVKRKFIREARDLWYELCNSRFAQGSGVLARFDPSDDRSAADDGPTPDTDDGTTILRFHDYPDQTAVFTGILSPAYRGTGIRVRLYFVTNSVVGFVQWQVSLRRDLMEDKGRESGSSRTVVAPCPAEHLATVTADFEFDPPVNEIGAGDPIRLLLTRQSTAPADTAAADAELLAVEVFELQV